MPHIDPTLRDMGVGPTPPTQVGPDGAPIFTPAPMTPIPREPVSLCMLGPCVRYHELAAKIDAQEPQDGSAAPAYAMAIRTCYPTPGIEIDLSTPVKHCNLWEPRLDVVETRARYREAYSKSQQGRIELKQFEESWPQHGKEEDDGTR